MMDIQSTKPKISNIYNQKPKKHDLPKKGTHLPPMQHETHSRSNSSHSVNAKQKVPTVSEAQIEAAIANADRIRVALREKEIENAKLKDENNMLKQRDRQNQRSLQQLEQIISESPKIIDRLKEELVLTKNKLKTYYAQIGDDSRLIRQINDDKLRLQKHNMILGELAAANDLPERDFLNRQLEESNQKIRDLQLLNKETERNLEMIERNLMADNRYLRGKIHSLERERALQHEQVLKLHDTIQEKDKTIASLSIYRYNVIHHKSEAGCKVCAKRERDENIQKRKDAILSHLPVFEIKNVSVLKADRVLVDVGCVEVPQGLEFSSITVSCSEDGMMVERVLKTSVQYSSIESLPPVEIAGLISGNVYHFNVFVSHKNVNGLPSKPVSLLVDELPLSPIIIRTEVVYEPLAIKVFFKPNEIGRGSSVLRYKVYQSFMESFDECYLAFDGNVNGITFQDGEFMVYVNNPQIITPHYFKVSAINCMGESQLSEISKECIIGKFMLTYDFVPPVPMKPIVKRISSNSIKITTSCLNVVGSSPTVFHVTCQMITEKEDTLEIVPEYEEKLTVLPKSPGKNSMCHVLENVEHEATFRFCVCAENGVGISESSQWSDPIDIESLVPALDKLDVSLTSATSFTVKRPNISSIKTPVIIGFRIFWSLNLDMTNPERTEVLDCTGDPYVVDNLIAGETYYIAASLVGQSEEGMMSTPVYMPLAAFVPLPDSPIPPTETLFASEPSITKPPLIKTMSQSSNLSINQKVVNMHHGMPANHDPPVENTGSRTNLSKLKSGSHAGIDKPSKSKTGSSESVAHDLRGTKSKMNISNVPAKKRTSLNTKALGNRSRSNSGRGSLPMI